MSEDTIWNLNEVNKELKPEKKPKKPKIVYKPWVEGVPDEENVVYLKLNPTPYNGKISLECVDYKGDLLSLGMLLRINNDNSLFRYYHVNENLGFQLGHRGKLVDDNE